MTRRPVPEQLPIDIAAFTGRDVEGARLRDHLTGAGAAPPTVCAVSGAGGIGKSALAIHVAHELKQHFPDGQLYVNLHGATMGLKPLEPSETLGRWLRAMGTDPEAVPTDTDEAAAQFRSLLAGRRVLVVCDNAVDAAQVRPLLPASERCAALVTSRRVLATLDNASHLRLDVLSEQEAVTLLHRLAGSHRVTAEPGEAATVARQCGYLPLAVRIAGAKLAAHPSRSIGALAELLADEGSRLDELHTTDEALATSLAVSYHDLRSDPAGLEAARMFHLLGLNTGFDISVPAAAALAGTTPRRARQLLDHLAEVHLVEHAADERYRFHDLVRIYAAERGAAEPAEQRDAAVLRMLCWYLHTADAADRVVTPHRPRASLDPPLSGYQPLTFTTYGQALQWFDTERANLVSAIRQAAGVGQHAISWKLTVALSVYFYLRKPWGDWINTHRIGLASVRHLDEPFGEAAILTGLGIAYYDQRQFENAIDHLRRAHTLWRDIDHRWGEAIVLNVLGSAYRDARRFTQAVACFRRALAIWPEIDEIWGKGVTLHNLGSTYLALGRPEQSVTYLEQAIAVRRAMPDKYGEAWAIQDLGVAYRDLYRVADAIACFEQALTIRREIDDRHGEEQTLAKLDELRRDSGKPAAAGDVRAKATSEVPATPPISSSKDLAAEIRRCILAHERRTGKAVKKLALAKAVGVSKSSLYAYLSGTTLPPTNIFDRLLEALDVSPTEHRRLSTARDNLDIYRDRA